MNNSYLVLIQKTSKRLQLLIFLQMRPMCLKGNETLMKFRRDLTIIRNTQCGRQRLMIIDIISIWGKWRNWPWIDMEVLILEGMLNTCQTLVKWQDLEFNTPLKNWFQEILGKLINLKLNLLMSTQSLWKEGHHSESSDLMRTCNLKRQLLKWMNRKNWIWWNEIWSSWWNTKSTWRRRKKRSLNTLEESVKLSILSIENINLSSKKSLRRRWLRIASQLDWWDKILNLTQSINSFLRVETETSGRLLMIDLERTILKTTLLRKNLSFSKFQSIWSAIQSFYTKSKTCIKKATLYSVQHQPWQFQKKIDSYFWVNYQKTLIFWRSSQRPNMSSN